MDDEEVEGVEDVDEVEGMDEVEGVDGVERQESVTSELTSLLRRLLFGVDGGLNELFVREGVEAVEEERDAARNLSKIVEMSPSAIKTE